MVSIKQHDIQLYKISSYLNLKQKHGLFNDNMENPKNNNAYLMAIITRIRKVLGDEIGDIDEL